MNHHLGLGLLHPIFQGIEISQIGRAMVPIAARRAFKRELAEEVWLRLGFKGIAPNMGTKLLEPKKQPAAFEVGVAGEENAASVPGGILMMHRRNDQLGITLSLKRRMNC